MKYLFLAVSLILGITLGFVARTIIVRHEYGQQTVIPTPEPGITPTPFVYRPPADSMTLSIASDSGKLSIDRGDGTHIATPTAMTRIQQDDDVVVMGKSTLKTDDGKISVTTVSNAEIATTSLLPNRILFTHINGETIYEAEKEISVRSGIALIALPSGKIRVKRAEGVTRISLLKGEASVAVNDKEYIVRITALKPRQEILVTDETKQTTETPFSYTEKNQ